MEPKDMLTAQAARGSALAFAFAASTAVSTISTAANVSAAVASTAESAGPETAAAPNLGWCPSQYACYFRRNIQGVWNMVLQVSGSGNVYAQTELAMNNGTSGKRACAYAYYDCPGCYDLMVSTGHRQVNGPFSLRTIESHKWADGGCPG